MKGALVELGSAEPNVVVFQFNPETLRHNWSQPEPHLAGEKTVSNPQAVTGLPGETFSFSLAMDATDQLADPKASVSVDARKNGLYSRLAALEMLMFPTNSEHCALLADAPVTKGEDRPVCTLQVPTVLFVWGPGRILPVRMTSLSITEKLYDSERLSPTHAEAQVELRVLTPEDLSSVPSSSQTRLAKAAYRYSQRLRQSLAIRNLFGGGDSVLEVLARVSTLRP